MNKQAIEAYLRQLQRDNANVPESDRDHYPEIKAITDALAILATSTTTDDFLTQLREKKNKEIERLRHELAEERNEQNKETIDTIDKAYQAELINWYNIIIEYVEEM